MQDYSSIGIYPGHTPIVEKDGILFKREDQNPTGSVKDRGISAQLSYAVGLGHKVFVISSSGNAGISAGVYCQKLGLKLTIFVSPRTAKGKLGKLGELGVEVRTTEKPLFESLKFAQETGAVHLRQSRDEVALGGYSALGDEIFEQFGKETSNLEVFFPVSSGATLVGVGDAYRRLIAEGKLEKSPKLHAVQTTFIHPVAGGLLGLDPRSGSGMTQERRSLDCARDDNKTGLDYNKESEDSEKSLGLASALCAPRTPLKERAVAIIRVSGGSGWIVSEEEINVAWEILRQDAIETSAEGAVALAGVYQAQKSKILKGRPLCLLTGRKYD